MVDMRWMLVRPIYYVGCNGVIYTGMVVSGLALNQHSSYLIYQIMQVRMIEGLTIQCLKTLTLEILLVGE